MMKIHTMLFSFVVLAAAFLFHSTEAVYKGWKADRKRDRPLIRHMVHFGRVGCGGVLISWNHVLTAAHCPVEVGDTAFIGTSDRYDVSKAGIALPIVRSVAHPRYGTSSMARKPPGKGITIAGRSQSDIRILTLGSASASEMQARGVAPVPIDWNTHTWYPGKTAKLRVAGFGSTTVQCQAPHMRLELGDAYTTKCAKYPNNFPGADTRLQFCLDGEKGGQTVCRGDSGGPVFYKIKGRWTLVALVSGGEYAGSDCCVPREKWHAVNIAGFRDWINAQMGSHSNAQTRDWSCTL